MNTSIKQARDEWIALRCQHGEPEAFAELIREMERPLLYFAQKLVNDEDKALDVLQEVWMKVFRNIRHLQKPKLLRAWLYRLTRGLAIDRVRKEVAGERREKERFEEMVAPDDCPFLNSIDAAALHLALDTLDTRYREVVVLHFLEEMTISEIAGVLGCPAGTVKSRLYYAKKALKEILQRSSYGHPI